MAVDRIGGAICALLLLASFRGESARAQEAPPDAPAPAASPAGESGGILPKIRFGFEGRLNFRSSDENRFVVPYKFPADQLPVGQSKGFEETVNAGSHFEVSKLILYVDADWSENLAA